jgi:hypothetical protein
LISPKKDPLQLCFSSLEKVLEIDQVFYSMGAWDPFLPHIVPINWVFPLEYDLVVCNTLSHRICELSSPTFMDVGFPSDEAILEAILEAMIIDFRPPPKLEYFLVGYQ